MQTAQIDSLIKTDALRIASADKPFWYTSGELGPYYVNTHFLCGGEKLAVELLNLITLEAESPNTLPSKVLARLDDIYQSSTEFKSVIDSICSKIKAELPLADLTGVTGGQRRDWFFAPIVAKHLDKPCIYLYNDGRAFDERGQAVTSIATGDYINICDLLRVGSSYTSKWIPYVEKLGGKLRYSFCVVDRCEGGSESILAAGVEKSLSLFSFDKDFFSSALEKELISADQFELISGYLSDPRATIRSFLLANPDFLTDALNSSDENLQRRAKSLVENDFYQLN